MRRLLALVLLVIGAVVPADAHHSISGVYDRNRPVTIAGVIAEFHFVNPHPFVTLNVDTGAGRPDVWRLEMDNRVELVDVGMTAETLKAGDRITVTGSRARDGSRSLYVLRLDREADAFRYEQVGSSPRIGRIR